MERKRALALEKNALSIDDWSSTCVNCGQGAIPEEKTHESVIGYGVADGTKGCGIKWEFLTSMYGNNISSKYAVEMRPDLKWIDFTELLNQEITP